MIKINLITKSEQEQLNKLRCILSYCKFEKFRLLTEVAIREANALNRQFIYGKEAGEKLRVAILKLQAAQKSK